MKKYKLGELLTVKHGWAFKGEYFAESGKQSILTPGNFYDKGGFKRNGEKERYYTGEYPVEYLSHKGDLIVAMTEQAAGLLGSTAIVPEDNRYLHNQRIGLISCNEKMLDELDVGVKEIVTEDIRGYLTDYQQRKQSSKVTIDNIRYNLAVCNGQAEQCQDCSSKIHWIVRCFSWLMKKRN